jgi:hypothetical protein
MISVKIKTNGHSNTPAVRLKDKPSMPNKRKFVESCPNSFSSENILTPMHSAIMALQIKKALR